MKILILGGGGREHALAWAVSKSDKCEALWCAPGNAGIASLATCVDLDIESGDAVVEFCRDTGIDFVIIGPEAPLAAGVASILRARNIPAFGPSIEASKLESSKSFTKEICDKVGAPTAEWMSFKNAERAKNYIRAHGAPIVVKADGLAAGKGVVVAETVEEAEAAVDDILGGKFGKAGAEVVIEDRLEGEEASFFVLCDGETTLPLITAQDHKRAGDGDVGPNTGGMGAYTPAPIMTPGTINQVMREIINPVVKEMKKRGSPFKGVLYAGLMLTKKGPKLIEFNVRFGDPECQALTMRAGKGFLEALYASATGDLLGKKIQWSKDHAMTVVLAAKGYPGAYETGEPIGGLDTFGDDPDVMVFHAGTKEGLMGEILSNGGRVLNVTARGSTLQKARDRAYAAIEQIDWPGGFHRNDIGWRALTR